MRGYIGGYGDELRLYYTRFDPPVRKASLCIVHGFGEHQGKFLHVLLKIIIRLLICLPNTAL